ncbi:GD23845 [Drosophila simulans]|uniref:GD23845 n=1 Tax=Drosophila simulans TaxID=7240 RepID=B4Q478_DROSI|nr:GD23845 [Drosophila simulans]
MQIPDTGTNCCCCPSLAGCGCISDSTSCRWMSMGAADPRMDHGPPDDCAQRAVCHCDFGNKTTS